ENKNGKYTLNEDNFMMEDGNKYKVITLAQVTNTGDFYRTLFIFVFTTFLIVFIIASIIVKNQNIQNIIIPITDLTQEMEKLRIGELEKTISDKGFGEVRELGSAIEQL